MRHAAALCLLAIAPLLVSAASSVDNSPTPTPVGLWKTIDDASGKPKALVKIIEVNGELRGSISKLFLDPGEEQEPHCNRCQGDKKDASVLGLTILSGLHQDEDGNWSGGEILDPKNGDTYHSKLAVAADGKSLVMRGYIGVSLFGRSQTWLRVE